MKKTVLALGPYVGDFKNEILTFRPYISWMREVLGIDKVYVCSHRNRGFLYDFADHFIPVYEDISRDEIGQTGYIYNSLTQKDFNAIVKSFKEKIVEIEGCSKKDIDIYSLKYIKSKPPYSIYQKIFEEVSFSDIEDEYKDKLIFIPGRSADLFLSKDILTFLKDKGFIVIGDMKTYFPNENEILSNIDYFENGYQKIFKYISAAKAVVCPLSHWTVMANIQRVPVFSWGESVGQYRKNGIYYLDNERSMAYPSHKDIKSKSVTNMISHFLKGV